MDSILLRHVMVIVGFFTCCASGRSDPNFIGLLEQDLNHFRSTYKSRRPAMVFTDSALEVTDSNAVLQTLAKYEGDKDFGVRHASLWYAVKLAHLQPKPDVRQAVTARLVKARLDPNSGLYSQSSEWLSEFQERDFSADTKMQISRALAAKDGAKMIGICGIANIRSELPRLQEWLIDEMAYKYDPNNKARANRVWYHTPAWSARLARARMGVQEDVDRCIEMVESERTANERYFALLVDIGYIRQPKAIEYLRDQLNSEDRLPPMDGGETEPLAAYTINILADSLSDWPLPKRIQRGYRRHEIELCRKWMASQTTWHIIR